MLNKNHFPGLLFTALFLSAIIAIGLTGLTAFAQSGGPTSNDCYSARFHAASDCDRLASGTNSIPMTGAIAYGPTTINCYSARFHVASDCDRLMLQPVLGKSIKKP